jgi:hypothetical protein
MNSGHCYATPLDSPYFMLIPRRRFFTPWVWDVWAVRIEVPSHEPLASNLSRGGALGLLKLLNAYNVGD